MNRRRATLLALTLVASFASLFARLVLSPLVPAIIEDFSVSTGAIGLAFTCLWAAYAVTQYPAGALADRYGEKPVVLVALAAAGLTSVLLAAAPVYGLFLLGAVLLGGSVGLYPPAGSSLLTKRFTNTGSALGLHVAGANIAGLIAPVAAVVVAARFGWRAAPLLTTAIVVPLFLLFLAWVRPTPPDRGSSLRARLTPRGAVSVLSRPRIAFTAFLATVGTFAFGAVASFLPTFLVRFRGLSTTDAGAVFGLVYLCSALAMPATGRLSDRVGRDVVIAGSFGGVVSGLAILLVAVDLPTVVGAVVLGFGISFAAPIQSRFMDHLGDDERGVGFGLSRAVTGLLGSTGSVVVGSVADVAGWVPAYGLVAALLVAAVVLILANRVVGPGW
jgi:predicted MFS family arabinose efflux permease